jgi:hypothetical protein
MQRDGRCSCDCHLLLLLMLLCCCARTAPDYNLRGWRQQVLLLLLLLPLQLPRSQPCCLLPATCLLQLSLPRPLLPPLLLLPLWVEAVKLVTQLLAVLLLLPLQLLTPPQALLLCVAVCQYSSSACAICCCWRCGSKLRLVLLAKEPVGFAVPHKDLRPWRQVPGCFEEHTVARELLVKPTGAWGNSGRQQGMKGT